MNHALCILSNETDEFDTYDVITSIENRPVWSGFAKHVHDGNLVSVYDINTCLICAIDLEASGLVSWDVDGAVNLLAGEIMVRVIRSQKVEV